MKSYQTIIFVTGAVLLLAGAAVYITGWEFAPYLYSAGAVMFAAIQLLNGYSGQNIVIRRLRRQQIFAAILLMLTGLFMFTTRGNEWIVSLTIAAFLELYTSFRISKEEEKESEAG